MWEWRCENLTKVAGRSVVCQEILLTTDMQWVAINDVR